MQRIALFIHWSSVAAIVWTLVGYPMMLLARSRRARPARRGGLDAPTVCVIITVSNEEQHIASKLANTLAQEWPHEPFELIVVSDGSTDASEALARATAPDRVQVLSLARQSGKHACQGLAVRSTQADIVVFTDVTTELDPHTLAALITPFEDPGIGCVSGFDLPTSVSGRMEGESVYVRYEMALRTLEVGAGSMVSASGCLFAVRRSLCDDWQEDLTSDFALPLVARLRGLRTVTEPSATCRYRVSAATAEEAGRKVRTVVHGLRVLRRYARCLDPRVTGFFALQLASHKLMRWSLPYFLLTLFITSVVLAPTHTFYLWSTLFQTGLYGVAAVGLAAPALSRFALVRWSVFAVMVNVSMLVAWRHALAGNDMTVWRPTRRD